MTQELVPHRSAGFQVPVLYPVLPAWCAIVDDLRTWLLESDEYLPLIDGENVLLEGSVAGSAMAA